MAAYSTGSREPPGGGKIVDIHLRGWKACRCGCSPYNVARPCMNLSLQSVRWDGLFPPESDLEGLDQFAQFHRGRTVLVTGAGGSIGSALARAIHRLDPHTLLLLDSSEQNLYSIHRDLSALAGPVRLVPVLGSAVDENCMSEVFQRFGPRVVYHAAALK